VSSADPQALDNLPTAVLYDVFRDASTALTAAYIARSDQATTPQESKQWWDRILALRDAANATDPDDRRALAASIQLWQRQAAELRTG
jgi:hypothetical protein